MKHLNFNLPNGESVSLESIDERIANEATIFARIGNTIIDAVPVLLHGARKYFATTDIDKYDLRFLDVNETVLKRALNPGSYVNIAELPVVVTPGLKTNLMELSTVLLSNISYANSVAPRLQEYNQFLSGLISGKEHRASLRDFSGIMKKTDKDREQNAQTYSDCFTTNSVKAIMYYKDAVENNAQWFEVLETLKNIIDKAKVNPIKTIQSMTAETLTLIDELDSRVRANTVDGMSPETLKSLSATTLTMAREVEYYCLTLYRISVFKQAFEQSSNDLIRALR